MKRFRDLTIQRKFVLMQMALVLVVLVILNTIFIVSEIKHLNEASYQQLVTQADRLSGYASAALLLNNPFSLHKDLDLLSLHPEISAGYVYDKKFNLFAKFEHPGSEGNHKLGAQLSTGDTIDEQGKLVTLPDQLHFFLPVTFDAKRLGFVQVVDDQSAQDATLKKRLLDILLIDIAILAIVFLLANWFARLISDPVTKLQALIGRAVAQKDYQLRAENNDEDDIGQLADGCNSLLQVLDDQQDIVTKCHQDIGQLVTERTQDLTQTLAQVTASSEAKSQFLTSMSHELRTPLSGALGMTENLLNTNLSTEQRNMADIIYRTSESLLTIVNNILDFSKIETGELTLKSAPFSIQSAIGEIVTIISSASSQHRAAKIQFEIGTDVPHQVIGDIERYQQVLLNLVSNVVQLTLEGDVQIKVAVDQVKDGTLIVRTLVQDMGIGIHPEEKAQIIDTFRQNDMSDTKSWGGAGLSLFISRRLAEMMGGGIGIESIAGEGLLFWYTVKVAVVTDKADTPDTVHSKSEKNMQGLVNSELPRFSGHVLLVEDNPVSREVGERFLKRMGCSVDLASNGREAVEAEQDTEYDLILMDLQMPEIDGLEAMRMIRARKDLQKSAKSVPIAVVTAHAMQSDKEYLMGEGVDDYLSKPFTQPQLAALLRRWLKRVDDVSPDNDSTSSLSESLSSSGQITEREDLQATMSYLFQKETPPMLRDLHEAVKAQDAEAIAKCAHRLGTSAAFVDATEMSELCRLAEQRAAHGNLANSAKYAQEIDTAFRQTLKKLKDVQENTSDKS